MTADAAVTGAVWLPVLATYARPTTPGDLLRVMAETLMAVVLTVSSHHVARLYRARVCTDRRVVRSRMAVAAAVIAMTIAELDTFLGFTVPFTRSVIAAGGTALALAIAREAFEQWLAASRARGKHVRPVLLVGSAAEVAQITHLLDAHPETGCQPVGWLGETTAPRLKAVDLAFDEDEFEMTEPPTSVPRPWLGPTHDLVAAVHTTGASGVLVGPSVASSPRFAGIARQLYNDGVHVQLWSGMWGIDPRRLHAQPLAHEPFFYLEPAGHLLRKAWLKRALDVTVASLVLVAASPILAIVAFLVKRHDGGPVFFRQKRVGQHGEVFELRKFRTMGTDAEARLGALKAGNERTGPLFKLTVDPRVTPIGKILRATSMDELPQLLDVLAGNLSLVGPRPALPDEVAEFDDLLLGRHDVIPGITGLWQVEARHNPSFDAYRHLDLFYVENWTVLLDIAILLATVKRVVADTIGHGSSAWRRLRTRQSPE